MSDHFQDHDHEALAHSHRHFHVTHNMSAGGFEHLSSEHDHEHDHAALRHAHVPHENFDSEHHGEAHVHDHVEPVRSSTARKTRSKPGTRQTGDGANGEVKGTTRRRTAARATAS